MNFNGIPEQKIREALFFLNYDDQEEWIAAGQCIRHELGGDGLEMWLSWSALSSAYKRKEAVTRWKSFKGSRRKIGTLFYLAMQNGFRFNNEMTRISPEVLKQREEKKKIADAEAEKEEIQKEKRKLSAKEKAQQLWESAKPCDSHPYLTKKDVMAHGCRVGAWTYKNQHGQPQTENNALLVPLFCKNELMSLQAIFPQKVETEQSVRDKFYMFGAQKSGVYAIIGEPTDTILICEGWATGATIHEATQLYTIVALDSGNITSVAKEIRAAHPFARIIICADNDQYKKQNTGIKSAIKAACEVDADICYPVFKDTTSEPTDFNDLYHERGSYDDVYERIMKPRMFTLLNNDSVPALNAFDLPYVDDYKKVLEESTDPLKVASAGLYAGLSMSEQYPAFVTLDMIRDYVQHPLIHHQTHLNIMCRIQWSIHNRRRVALSAIKPEKWAKHNHVVVNSLDEITLNSGVNLVFAPMGSGKTQKVIKPFSQIKDKVFCAVAHRRSLISELAKRLQVENYEEAKSVDFSEKVAVCLPSAMSNRFLEFTRNVENLAIDEISQNIRFTKSKECKATGVDQEGVYLGLKDVVNKSEIIVAADASIDQTTLDFFEQARPDEQFTIYEQVPNNKKEKKCYMHDEESLLSYMQIELINGGNVWLAVESVAKAEAINELFKNQFNVMLVTSKNSTSKEVKKFLAHVQNESRKYNLVIASPAISSGVSVEHDVPHFTMIAGIASGAAICFSDFAQMLARVRYVDEYHVCLKKNNHRFENVTANAIIMGQRQAAMLEGASVKENEYTKTMALIDERERAYRADFANGFIWFLEYYCFEILPPPPVQLDYSILDTLKQITKENKEKYRNAICTAEVINQEQADKLDSKKSLSGDEQITLMAFNIKKLLGYTYVHELKLLDIDMFEQLPAIDRFARYMGLVPKTNDTEKNISLRKFANAQVRATELIFSCEKVDDIIFSNEKCREIIERISSNQNRFMLSALKLVPSSYARDTQDKNGKMKEMKVPTNCANAMGRVLEKFGLSWERKHISKDGNKSHVYQVTPESFNLMQKYAERRYKSACI